MKNYLLAAIASFLFLLSCSENSTNSSRSIESYSPAMPLYAYNQWNYMSSDGSEITFDMSRVSNRIWNNDNKEHETYKLSLKIKGIEEYPIPPVYFYTDNNHVYSGYSTTENTVDEEIQTLPNNISEVGAGLPIKDYELNLQWNNQEKPEKRSLNGCIPVNLYGATMYMKPYIGVVAFDLNNVEWRLYKCNVHSIAFASKVQ